MNPFNVVWITNVMIMVFNATFNISSVISWRSVLLVEDMIKGYQKYDMLSLLKLQIFTSKLQSANTSSNHGNVDIIITGR